MASLPILSQFKWSWIASAFFGLASGGFQLSAAAVAGQLWTCGMHPQIIKSEPGNCPICGMKLTPIRANDAGGGGASSSAIQIDAATTQRMNLKTALVANGPVRREFRAVGSVTYNEQGLRDITTKYEGWIEKLHVNATWTDVKAGDPLFDIYSPDLYNAQLNYLVALRSEGAAGGPLTRAGLARLQLFDLPEDFIAEFAQGGEPRRTYTFRSPQDGVVIEKMAVAGQMMKPGERLYRLAELSSVWVLAQIYERDLPFVQEGQSATVRTTFGPEREFAGTVEMILPEIKDQTRTATARLVMENPGGALRPGTFVDVRFTAQIADDAVLVPDVAVLRSGERNTVFIALEGGAFEPREVVLGARSEDDFYEVKSGLAAGERVVTSGQFMLDSESQLREAIQKMLRAAGSSTPAAASVELPDGVTVYTCPMDVHAHVVSDQPGTCGECAMTLVPADTVDHGGKSEAIWLEQHGAHAH